MWIGLRTRLGVSAVVWLGLFPLTSESEQICFVFLAALAQLSQSATVIASLAFLALSLTNLTIRW
jgi:hypothetical protein